MDKKLIILSGVPGAGKSTYANSLRVHFGSDCVLSMDTIREMCGCIVRDTTGEAMHIDQSRNKQVFALYYRMVDLRMQSGAVTVLDNTHPDNRSMEYAKELAEKYGYSVEVHRINCSEAILAERNKNRGYKQVPHEVLVNMLSRYHSFYESDWFETIYVDRDDADSQHRNAS